MKTEKDFREIICSAVRSNVEILIIIDVVCNLVYVNKSSVSNITRHHINLNICVADFW